MVWITLVANVGWRTGLSANRYRMKFIFLIVDMKRYAASEYSLSIFFYICANVSCPIASLQSFVNQRDVVEVAKFVYKTDIGGAKQSFTLLYLHWQTIV
jgi:hypothetical protein